MKKKFTHAMFYISLICTSCVITASAQQPDHIKKQFPFSESKNIFKRHDVKTMMKHEKSAASGINNNDRSASMTSLVQILDSVYFWSWDTIAVDWKTNPHGKSINFIYNSNNRLLSYNGQEWNGSTWVNSFRTSNTYDLNNNRTNILQEQWNGTAWVNQHQLVYTYDVNHNNLSYLSQSWNGSSWDNQFQDFYTYDANNNLLTALYQTWNGSSWDSQQQDFNTYDVNNNKISVLHQTWSGAWIDETRDSLAYDVNNNWIYQLSQTWDGLSWNNFSQMALTYDVNNNFIYLLYQDWDGTSWENFLQEFDTYDANNNWLSYMDQLWNGSAWVNEFFESVTYDANNFFVSDLYKYFDITGTYVAEGDSSYYYYHTVPTSVAYNVSSDDDQIILYPVPAQNELQVIGKMLKKIEDIEIFDAQGRLVMKQFFTESEISPQFVINVSKLDPGMYIAIFNCGDRNYKSRFLIGR